MASPVEEHAMKIEIKDEALASSDEETELDRSLNGDANAHSNGIWSGVKQEEGLLDVSLTEDGVHQFVERYKCHHCDKSYKNLRSLNQHFREAQVCRVCKMSLPSVEEFTSHVLEDHTVGALCGVCMISFRSRARLVEHVRTHTELVIKKPDVRRARKAVETAKTCKICAQELSPLAPHTCHANVCKVCRKPLRTRNEFEVHMMRLHCTEDTCQFCSVRLPSLASLISHLKSHTSLRYPAHKCVKCGTRFNNAARLAAHTCQSEQDVFSPPATPTSPNKHLNSSPNKSRDNSESPEKGGRSEISSEVPREEVFKYECAWCEQKFKYLRDLKQHRAEEHSCQFCQKELRSRTEFEQHLMEAHSSKDKCQFCLRKFVCTTALRTHLKTHTHIAHMLHHCKKCNMKFTSIKEKNRHECTSFRCLHCDGEFDTRKARDVHRRETHSDLCSFKCNTCLKTLPTRQALRKHIIKKHKAEK